MEEGASKRQKLEVAKEDAVVGLARYDVGPILGEGAFAVVRRAVVRETGVAVAMKAVNRHRSRPEMAAREVKLLKSAGTHKHICSLIEYFETSPAYIIVLELVCGGEVFERVAQKGTLSEASAAQIVHQAALALAYLHGREIIHRDLKPENLLYVSLKPESDIKLADFGLAVECQRGKHATGEAGTISYIAPEVFSPAAKFDHAVDLWALGACLFTILGGYLPFDPGSNAPPMQVRRRILTGQPAFTAEQGGYPGQWESVSAEARRIIGLLLEPDPSRRITAEALLVEPWVTGVSTPTSQLCVAKLTSFNDARKMWRTAADSIALVIRAPHAAASVATLVMAAAPSAPASVSNASTTVTARTISGETSGAGAAVAGGADGTGVTAAELPLSEPARKELEMAFKLFDEDGSGAIDLEELKHAMRALGTSEGNAEAMLETLDTNHDGTVSFDECVAQHRS